MIHIHPAARGFIPNTGGIHALSSEEPLGFGDGNRKRYQGAQRVVVIDIKEEITYKEEIFGLKIYPYPSLI